MPRILVLIAAIALLATTTAHAQPTPLERRLLPGIGPTDKRTRIDPKAAPWRSIGRLQANGPNVRRTCTASLVGPRLVLTAAHCLYNERTETYLAAPALHFLLAYSRGTLSAHADGVSFMIAPGWKPSLGMGSAATDWALITLDADIGTPDLILGFASEKPAAGKPVVIGGYSGDYVEVVTADEKCQMLGPELDRQGGSVIKHNCAATRGASGAPMLVREGTSWRIAGVEVGADLVSIGGVAAQIDAILPAVHGQKTPQKPNM
jgi:protease YdgD